MKRCINLLKALVLLVWFIPSLGQSIGDLKELLSHLPLGKKTLVIFDIDNVLLQPETDLGSDQWFSHAFKECLKEGLSVEEALQKLVPIFAQIHLAIDLIPTQEGIIEILDHLKNANHPTICLTSRSFPLIEKTINQLQKHTFSFAFPPIKIDPVILPEESFAQAGILFCGKNDKGPVLESFLKHMHELPELIIFIDDKEHHLTSVEKIAQQLDIDFIGLRYGGCDERVSKFDPALTAIELEQFLMHYPRA